MSANPYSIDSARRKIDPYRKPECALKPDGTPDDNDRVEIGPTALAFAEWEALDLEIPHLDTMELWKFGDFKHYTSLKLLAHILGVPEPKEDMDGSMVRDVFYEEGDLQRITHYCEQDVITVARIFIKLQGGLPLQDDEIIRV